MASFMKFRELPVEIQSQIWIETARLSRTVDVYIRATGTGAPHRHSAYSPNPLPAMMRVNAQAHGELMKMLETVTNPQGPLINVQILNEYLLLGRNDVLHVNYTSWSAGEQLACAGILDLLEDRSLPVQTVKRISITSRRASLSINPQVSIFESTRILKDMVLCLLLFPCLDELTADFPASYVNGMTGLQQFLGDDTALWAMVNQCSVAWGFGNRMLFMEVGSHPGLSFRDMIEDRQHANYQYAPFEDWGLGACKITLKAPRN